MANIGEPIREGEWPEHDPAEVVPAAPERRPERAPEPVGAPA